MAPTGRPGSPTARSRSLGERGARAVVGEGSEAGEEGDRGGLGARGKLLEDPGLADGREGGQRDGSSAHEPVAQFLHGGSGRGGLDTVEDVLDGSDDHVSAGGESGSPGCACRVLRRPGLFELRLLDRREDGHSDDGTAACGDLADEGLPRAAQALGHVAASERRREPASGLDLLHDLPRAPGQGVGARLEGVGASRGVPHVIEPGLPGQDELDVPRVAAPEGTGRSTGAVVGEGGDEVGAAHGRREGSEGGPQHVRPVVPSGEPPGGGRRVEHERRATGAAEGPQDLGVEDAQGAELGDLV